MRRPAGGRWRHHQRQPADGGHGQLRPAVVAFYKVELGIPSGPEIQGPTLGETHNTPVVNGMLEWLQAEALAPGV